MFLHLGGLEVTQVKKIIAILNMEKTSLLKESQNKLYGKEVKDISGGKAKSAVITDDKIIITPISSFTLAKRTKQNKKVYAMQEV